MMHSSGIFMPERPVEESAVVAKKTYFTILPSSINHLSGLYEWKGARAIA